MALELLSVSKSKDSKHRHSKDKFVDFHVPSGLNLLEDTEYASQAALWGIEGLPELGEIYPIGGAGDRLGLVDSDTGESLPAALLPYCGRSLLEGLMRDLQAREFLHFKIFGKQCITPVAVMTSSVKNNHEHIVSICERLEWFGRGRENFRLFEQPLVPVVNAEDGKWLISESLLPVGKPGGHGAIWKLACDRGIFEWLYRHGRKGATVRQVSNVVAATDLTLMALAGIGLRHNKKLGFASCERRPGATEGVNVLIEKQNFDGLWKYGITCIEYTEFEKYGISEPTATNGSLQASYPANTNILYVDLEAAQEVGSRKNASCLPGIVLNLKKAVSYVDHLGFECSAAGGRLECTMQNIADNFMNTYSNRCSKGIESELDTFIVYNERKKVTSSAKRKLKSEDISLHQTPEGSLLDIMRNAHDLLSSCNIEVPKVKDNNEYLHSGLPFLIFLHPALGPFWDIIKQKFIGGSIAKGSELQIEAAEFLWEDVELDGSLIILADNIMGSTKRNAHGEQILHYGARCGRCKLQNVKIVPTAFSKKLRFLIRNKSSFSNPNINREDGSAAHSYFHRSERRKSTLAACSTIADGASTSTSKCSESGTGTKKEIAKKKNSRGSKKEVSADVKEKKVSTKKKSTSAKTSKTAAKTTEKASAKQEEKKTDASKPKKGVSSSKEKTTVTRSKKPLKAKESAAIAAAEAKNCMKTTVDSSGSERRPLVPLYPPVAKSVVVVESATKAKVIQKYLGDMYEVLPSYGHVRDLAGRSKSVRPDDDFSMVWEVPTAAWTHLKSIKVALKGAENLILASDPDREGEAIAWHIKEMLEQQQDVLGSHVTVARVVFHEITEDAIKNALMSPRHIDMDLVNAYLARRSLDYLIGFGISPLLWRKLPGCQSAGRVQSAALALVCDRETEIEQFSPQEYWTVDTEFKTQCSDSSKGLCLTSRIKLLNSKKLDQLSISSQEEAQAIEKRIYSCQFEVKGVKRSKISKNPPMPYITSSLQQDAANKLHFGAGRTMKVAQKLYEGINLSSEQTTGLITYLRTDGFHISDGAAEDIRSLVKERYGEQYAPEDIRKYLNKVKNAQEAHEAIRPTSIRRLPSSLIGILDEDSLKLYTLIWRRTMACQMEASRTELIQVDIGNPEGDMIFHSSASRLDFKGYQAVYEDTEASGSSESPEGEAAHQDNFEALSKLEMKDLASPVNVNLGQHFTKPPSRFSEGALIKKMEELGIGRPSTYASIMRVLQDRKYVTIKSRVLHPEFRGRMVSAFLSHLFSEIADYSFTANMETELDNVSAGSTEWKGLLTDYWERFSKYCTDASQWDVRKVERMLEEKFLPILFPDLDTDSRICPSCSEGTLRFKVSRYGEGYFIGCDRHPKCKYIARTLSDEDDENETSEETPKSFEPRLLGVKPDTNEKVFLKQGPYGYYIQVGEDRKGASQKRAPISEVKDVNSITIEDAIELLQYPKVLGKHPDDEHPVLMTHSKAGFSVRHRRSLAPVPKTHDPKKVTLERALKYLTGKNVKKFGRPKGKTNKNAEPIEWH